MAAKLNHKKCEDLLLKKMKKMKLKKDQIKVSKMKGPDGGYLIAVDIKPDTLRGIQECCKYRAIWRYLVEIEKEKNAG